MAVERACVCTATFRVLPQWAGIREYLLSGTRASVIATARGPFG